MRFTSVRQSAVLALALLLWQLVTTGVYAQATGDTVRYFDNTIAPLLAKRCLSCHGGHEPKGELDLSSNAAALRGGSGGPAIIPGNTRESLLWQQIESDTMPPKQPLTAAEKRLVEQWLNQGAQWGTDPIDVFQFSSETRAGRDWWSLQPISAKTMSTGDQHPVDVLVQEKRTALGLAANPPADKRTLLRRVFLDMIGLPPTAEDLQSFLSDSSPNAYAAVVDRLLESPHYGERWARHWLDVVRFGESNGFEYDEPRDNFWPYRNWVIDAFNADMPYDQFAREQIAGDAWRPDDVHAAAASGFLVAGPHNTTLPANAKMRMAMAQDEVEDLLGSLGQTFLGLTINCARCHDHKFDPISQKEYYQLAAAVSGVTHGQRTLPVSLSQTQLDRLVTIEKRLSEVTGEIESLLAPTRDRLRAEREASQKSLADKLKGVEPPEATATWEFDGDLKDSHGRLDLEASGGAVVEDGALVLDGKQAYAATPLLAETVNEKTLEVWVKLSRLDQRGGGAIAIETKDGSVFDAIVFAEREPKKWMAGSNNFVRSRSFQVDAEDEQADKQTVHIAMVYQADGTIAAYRDGQVYGQPYQAAQLQRFEAGSARLVFGIRHSPAGGNKMLAGRIERARFTNRALSAKEVELSAAFQEVRNIPRSQITQQLDEPARQRLAKLDTEAQQLREERKSIDKLRQQTIYTCVSARPGKTNVLLRGDVGTPAEEVLPAGLRAIGAQSDWKLSDASSDFERRQKLAEWITSPNNPLFARVIVNRLWQYHFGQGLVATPSDFGFNGGQPTHPELLDWLASELIRHGYRLKPIHRLIVTSQTYCQSAQPNEAAQKIDADNRYLWRKSPQRLEAETLRDAILVVSDRLDRQVGGIGYRDMRHYFYKGSHFYELVSEINAESNRRTIYRFTPRGNQNPFLSTFDCPDPSATAPRRPVTTTPLQALALLNNAMIFELADQFARRIEQRAGQDISRQIQTAYELAYCRAAQPEEVARCRDFVQQQGLPALCRVIFNSNEFLYVR